MIARTAITALTYRGHPVPHPQLVELEAIRAACDRATIAALKGKLFESVEGMRLINAMHDLTGCDELYDMAIEAGIYCGVNLDGSAIIPLGASS